MATAKKPTTKKPAAKVAKTTTVKKTTVAKTAPKKTVAKKSGKKTASSASADYKSFKLAKNNTPFTTFKVTRQTFYWIILVAFIIFIQLWILKLHIEVAGLLEQQQIELRNEI